MITEGKCIGVFADTFYECLKGKNSRDTTISSETYEELEFAITNIFGEIFNLNYDKANVMLWSLFRLYKEEIDNEKN